MDQAGPFTKLTAALAEIEASLGAAGTGLQERLALRPLSDLDRGDLASEMVLGLARNTGEPVHELGRRVVERLSGCDIGVPFECSFDNGFINIRFSRLNGRLPELVCDKCGDAVAGVAPQALIIVPPRHRPAGLRLAARALVQRAALGTYGIQPAIYLAQRRLEAPTLVDLWVELQDVPPLIWEDLCTLLKSLAGQRVLVWLWPQEYPERAFRELVASFRDATFRAPPQRWFEELRAEELGCIKEQSGQERSHINILAGSLDGIDVDLAVARYGEAWNLPWFYRSLLKRAERILGEFTAGAGSLSAVEEDKRILWHRFTMMPLFRAWAAVQGDVGEYLDALIEVGQFANRFLNNPARRIAWAQNEDPGATLPILAGVSRALRDTIKSEPVLWEPEAP